MMVKVNTLRQLQSESQKEVDALLPSPKGDGSQSVVRPKGGALRGKL